MKYESKNATAPARRKRKIRNAVLGGLAAMLTIGGPALAVMLIESNEATAKVEAGTAAPLELGDATAVKGAKLFPGMSVDVAFTVKNPNPFPVTLTTVTAGKSKALKVTCAVPSDAQYLSTGLAIAGTSMTLKSAVELDAGETKTVTIADAVKLKKDASGGCSLETGFVVRGLGAGSGN